MADIKVRFEVNPNAESELLGDIKNDNAEVSNVSVKTNSSNVFQNIPTSESNGINALSFGQDLVFDEQGYLDNEDLKGAGLDSEQNPTEFVWGVVPESKQYSVKITFTNARDLKDIVVYGDKSANQFPTRAVVDGKTEIFSDDYRWAINLQTESDTHTIEFTHWNRANYNACLTLIMVMLKYFEIDKRKGLKLVQMTSQTTGEPENISYGTISGDGELELLDNNGEFLDLINDNVLPTSDVKIEVIANGNKILNCESPDSKYIKENKSIKIKIGDIFSRWSKIKIPKFKSFSDSSLYSIFSSVLTSAGYNQEDILKMLSKDIKYEIGYSEVSKSKIFKTASVYNYLQGIKTYGFRYYKEGNLLEIINSFCEIAQLKIIQENDGQIYFVNGRPRIDDINNVNVINIPLKSQKSNFESSILLKNKYDNVLTSYIDYDYKPLESVYSYNGDSESISDLVTQASVFLGSGTSERRREYVAFVITISKADLLSFGNNPANKMFKYTLRDADYPNQDYKSGEISTNNYNTSDINEEDWKTLINNSDTSRVLRLTNYSTLNSETLFFQLWNDDDNFSSKRIGALELEVFGTTVTFSKNQYKRNNNPNIYSLENDYITYNMSMNYQIETSSGSSTKLKTMLEIISDNIIEDYSDGIKTAKTKVICGDYYDTNSNMVRNWSMGEVIKVGDIVRIEKDIYGTSIEKYKDGKDMYFKVTGRNFIHDGVPLIELELQEVKY